MSPSLEQLTTLVDVLRLRTEQHGNTLLYRYLETGDVDGPIDEWSYARLEKHARALGTLLREEGASGKQALLLYPPGMDFIAGFMGCLYGGAVAVPTYPPDPSRMERTLPRLRAIAQDSGASYVLTTSAIRDMAEFMLPQAPELGALRWLATDTLPEELAQAWKPPALSGTSLAFLQYTSGSTGTPKGVMVTHANILHNEAFIARSFGHDPERSSALGWLPLFHDMGLIGKVLQPLTLGFPCTLMSPLSFLQRPMRWLEAISQFRATTSGAPNFAYDLCVRKATDENKARLDLSSWDLAFNGAEPIRQETFERFAETFAPCGFRREALYACYGLAEATLIASGGRKGQSYVHRRVSPASLERQAVEDVSGAQAEGRTLVSSGRGAPDQRLLIVNPETREPRRVDEVGEIWLSGPSVAQGYWNRPEETEHAFAARTAGGEGPFLRTGDLGFLSASGELFVTGRRKDLLIIRGRNLYPQDLELTVERSHRSVRAGCCAAFPVEVEGEERLVVAAEADTREGLDMATVVDAIRQAIAEEHLVHAHAVVLLQPRSIPKTSSGKIQRHACRDGFLSGSLEVLESSVAQEPPAAFEAPAVSLKQALESAPTEDRQALLERILLVKVAQLLRVDAAALRPEKELAALGLDSLLSMELQAQLESELGFALPTTFLWQHPTLQDAAFHLRQAWQGAPLEGALAAPPLTSGLGGAAPPLSSGQFRLWFLDRIAPGRSLYNIHFRLRMTGALDVTALQHALRALPERHAGLRATFPEVEGQPRLILQPKVSLELPWIDLSALPEAERPAALEQRAQEHARQPFDLSQGPLMRACLVKLASQEHLLLMTQHHIVTDGWSIGVLAQELARLYRAALGGPPVPPPAVVQYGDWAQWQRSLRPLLDGQRDWWARKLGGIPRLELLTDKTRPREPSFQGALHHLTLPLDLVENLKALGRQEGCTLFVVLAAAWASLLNRYTGQEDFGLGTVTAHRDKPEVREVVGFFAHTLVLRCDVSGTPTFRTMLARMRETFHEALAHSALPFEEVVDAARVPRSADNPLFQTCLLMENLPPLGMDVPGMEWQPELPVPDGAVEGTAKFDISLSLVETPRGLAGAIEYRTDLFEAATMDRLAGHFEQFLRGAASHPHQPIRDLPLLTSQERHSLLVEWNALSSLPPLIPATCIHEQIASQAALTPQATAVAFEGHTLSYEELERRANRLAWHLRSLGVSPGAPVGLCVERSLEMVVGMLGILKAGAAYLPLDPDYPRERLTFMLADSGASVLLTQRHLEGTLPGAARTVVLDTPGPFASGSDTAPPSSSQPEDLAYVIYTSGSTGRPKGVMVPHATVARFFTAMDQRLGGPRPGTWLALTSISFDISVLELLWTLARGFKVVLQGEEGVRQLPARRSPRSHARPMEFSLFYFADDSEQLGTDRYQLLLEGARFADEHGFAAVWTPERHFHAFGGLYPNPAVTGAAIAAVTKRVGIRAGSVVSPLHHPVRVAEEWALVDNLSKGRLGISFASGWHADDFIFAPHQYEKRREHMMEGIDTIRRLWRGEPQSFLNGVGQSVTVQIRPRPIQPELPFWLTAAGNPETFRAAGRLGARLLTHLLGQTMEDLERHIALYREAWREAGHPGEGHITLMLHTYVDADPRRVRARVEKPFRQYLKSSLDLMRGLGRSLGVDIQSATPEEMDRLVGHAFERYFETSGLFGTPRELREKVARLRSVGVDEIGALIDFGIATEQVLESLPYLDELRRLSERDEHLGERPTVAEQIHRHGITHLQCTPSYARTLLADEASRSAIGTLEKLLVGGEALPSLLAESLNEAVSSGEVLNMYGPTETTIWSSTHPARQAHAGPVVPIGTPIAHTQLYVLDPQDHPVPAGVAGELYIGGEGVVRGYLARPDLTAERFVPDPFSPVPGARLYRTGDRARWLANGRAEFLGRVDYQLKIRGFRIEAGEIEAVLDEHPSVSQAVVLVREDNPGDQRLIAYVVPRPGLVPAADALREHLRQRLPEYMVPSTFVDLQALPLTPNGKVDRKALPAPSAARGTRTEFVAPQGQLEQQIAKIWQDVLRIEQVGVQDNFFDLGGHSLLMVQVHTQLRERLGLELPLLKLLEHPSVGALARYFREKNVLDQAPLEAAQDRAKRQLESMKRQRQRLKGPSRE
ncbi:MupA/Atu3671 family FMN-dependent luciferase-like monooxygenase [Stigmatella aurantiaca]|uniref:Non-ribosomal peptide synthase n=1 Tax=Stigmatella aurantiaca (strain DW4/3-1) TaxID=378806 RepID=E3FQU6_STIAD|nr:MupA/Atu3671 family FMN-dependent luciferase-like monooxygenase [Stigmatella aurantiaca]ADO71979.1 Non-ribosomal peptide synthase [Stigmatella aurantiaca DW4/3-1]